MRSNGFNRTTGGEGTPAVAARTRPAPLRRETLFTQIYDDLCAGLSGGRFLPGESVTLRQLADDFGTSIMPVREAVSRLISERALAMLPNRKVIVPEMSRERFLDLTDFRRIVESVAARRATMNITSKQIAALAATNEELLEGIKARDVGRALGANRDFHFGIYQVAGSEALMHAISNAWLQVGPFLYLSMTSEDVPWTTAHHFTAIEALEARDEDAVAQAILKDIDESSSHLLERNFQS